jgi:DNA mismatch repair ATPase MutS
MDLGKSKWTFKKCTLSDKSAQKEFNITEKEIIEAINDGKLQYRENSIHGNPYIRLLRAEVESFVNEKYGNKYLKKQKLKNDLKEVQKELKNLMARMNVLEKRKIEIQKVLMNDI